MTAADIPACVDVRYASLDELHLRVGQPTEDRHPDLMGQLDRVLRTTDPSVSWVATERGRVVGFGQGVLRGDLQHLAFLFVDPASQGRGVGRGLLEVPARCRRARRRPGVARMSTAVEAIQPVSTALYAPVRHAAPGLGPYARGHHPRHHLPAVDPGLMVRSLASMAREGRDSATFTAAVAAIDLAIYGFARPGDHAMARGMGRAGSLFMDRQGRVRGYGYVSTNGRLAPTVVDDLALLPGVVGHLVRSVDPATVWNVGLPGNSAAFRHLLAAGLRIEGPPILYCATWSGPPYERIVPTGFALP